MINVIIRYKGRKNNAKLFARDMINSGIVKNIREEEANLGYKYFTPYDDPETILLVSFWENQDAVDKYYNSPMMDIVNKLMEKYDIHSTIELYEQS